MLQAQDILRDDYATVHTSEPVSQAIAALEQEKEVFVADDSFIGLFQPQNLTKSKMDITSMKARNVAEHVPKVAPDDDMLHIAHLMFSSNTTALPVVENDSLEGAVHVYDIFDNITEVGGDELQVSDARTPDAHMIHEDATIQQAMGEMREKGVDRLPVTDGTAVSGFLSSSDLARKYLSKHQKQDKGHKPDISTRAFKSERHAPEIPVKDVMHTDVLRTEPSATLAEAARLMREKDVLSLLVDDAIITKRDILEALTTSVQQVEGTTQYKGWGQVDVAGTAKEQAQQVVENTAKKIQDYMHSEFELTIHVKEYESDGKRAKYSINARLNYPGGRFSSDKKHGWEFIQAIQEGMEALEQQARKQFDKMRDRS